MGNTFNMKCSIWQHDELKTHSLTTTATTTNLTIRRKTNKREIRKRRKTHSREFKSFWFIVKFVHFKAYYATQGVMTFLGNDLKKWDWDRSCLARISLLARIWSQCQIWSQCIHSLNFFSGREMKERKNIKSDIFCKNYFVTSMHDLQSKCTSFIFSAARTFSRNMSEAGWGWLDDLTQWHTYCKVKYWVLIEMQSIILLSFLYWEVF